MKRFILALLCTLALCLPLRPQGVIIAHKGITAPSIDTSVFAFHSGQSVYVIGSANVRNGASNSSTVIGTQTMGQTGTITATCQIDPDNVPYAMCNVDFASGADGWVYDDRLTFINVGFGAKTALFIRVTPSDDTGGTLPNDSTLNSIISTAASEYAASSMGQMTFTGTIVPGNLTLPHTIAYYQSIENTQGADFRSLALIGDAHTLAAAAGYDWHNYTFNFVYLPGVYTFGQLTGFARGCEVPYALVGDAYGIIGFSHDRLAMTLRANAWLTTSNQQFGACGACGGPDPGGIADPYDDLGTECVVCNFNLYHKNTGPRWIPDANRPRQIANGTYRIYASDTETNFNSGRNYGLRMPGHGGTDYWIELRQSPHVGTAGLLINWGGLLLLDMHPSTTSFTDSALSVGETFTDPEGRTVSFTTGGTTPQYADVVIGGL